jgi:hypothetical protein
MSLDVNLKGEQEEVDCTCHCGHKHKNVEPTYYYSDNITHNLGGMAEEAGIYKHLWRPEEIGITTAKELIDPLTQGLKLLKANSKHFETFNASNGWGLYEHFVPFVEKYLKACIEYPNAKIEVSR